MCTFEARNYIKNILGAFNRKKTSWYKKKKYTWITYFMSLEVQGMLTIYST